MIFQAQTADVREVSLIGRSYGHHQTRRVKDQREEVSPLIEHHVDQTGPDRDRIIPPNIGDIARYSLMSLQLFSEEDISRGEVMDWLMFRTEESDDVLENDDDLNNNTSAADYINGNLLLSECEDYLQVSNQVDLTRQEIFQ